MSSVLNEKTDETAKRIHLLTTPLCERKCPYCCNNLYTFEEIPYATDEELKQCEMLFLTGGEPFQFTNPSEIARYYKRKYHNIEKVIVYGNCLEFKNYLDLSGSLVGIDGLSLSIKNQTDLVSFQLLVCNQYKTEIIKSSCSSNRVYIFGDYELDKYTIELAKKLNFEIINREWQPLDKYKPAPDSIYRKM